MTTVSVQDVLGGSMDMIGTPQFQELIESIDQEELKTAIKALHYRTEFLATPYWKHVAKLVKDRDGHECRLCCSKEKPSAHHRSYRYHGEEHRHMDDLVTLCDACHKKHHDILPFPERYPDAPPAANSQSVTVASPESMVLITKVIADGLVGRKPLWHWMKANGYEPDKTGWRKRITGQMVPAELLEQPKYRKEPGRKVNGKPVWTWIRSTVRNYSGQDIGEFPRRNIVRCLDAVGVIGMEAAARTLDLPDNSGPDKVAAAIENLVMAQCGDGTPSDASDVLMTMIAGAHGIFSDDINYIEPVVREMLDRGFEFGDFLETLNREASFLGFLERSGIMGYKVMMRGMRRKT